jgi:hypothetical protein
MLIRKRDLTLNFYGFSRGVENRSSAVNLGAFDFFEGVIDTFLGHKKAECIYDYAKNNYFVNGLHIQ